MDIPWQMFGEDSWQYISFGVTRTYEKDRMSMPDNKTSTEKRTLSRIVHNFIRVNMGSALLSDSPGHGYFRRETVFT